MFKLFNEKLAHNLNRKDQWIFTKIFGLFIAVGKRFGNCFSPAIVCEWHGMKKPVSSHRPFVERPNISESLQNKLRERYEKRMAEPETFSHIAWLTITIRTNINTETRIYWRGWFRFDFNSAHLAQRFGKFVDTDFGGYYVWNSWFGQHCDL